MSFRWNMLSRALGLFVCLALRLEWGGTNFALADVDESSKMKLAHREDWKLRSPESAEDWLELEFARALRRRIAKNGLDPVGKGECPLWDDELERVLRTVDQHHEEFANGLKLKDITVLTRCESLVCEVETINMLHNARIKFADQNRTLALSCVKSYIDQNFFEYLGFCGRIAGEKYFEDVKQSLGIEELATYYNFDSVRDVNYVDAELANKISQLSQASCSESPGGLVDVLRAVDDKDNTWLAGNNVKTILSSTKYHLWNCDPHRLVQHTKVRTKFDITSSKVSKCMARYYGRAFAVLQAYCVRFRGYDPTAIQHDLAYKRAVLLNQRLSLALPSSDESRIAVRKFAETMEGEDFATLGYRALLPRAEKNYLKSRKCLFRGAQMKQLRALQTHCNNVIKALDSIQFLDLFVGGLAYNRPLNTLKRAYHMCKLFVEVDLDARFESAPKKKSSCLYWFKN